VTATCNVKFLGSQRFALSIRFGQGHLSRHSAALRAGWRRLSSQSYAYGSLYSSGGYYLALEY
jgi:hypothetical protein